ncbi:MAG: hypothetical protein K8T10_21690 [Candidatus Eremiobacteraeota bacterium]|nr:hypothetical protein [Candidatus Eremiobacteraeota bacterium]
MGIMDQIWGVFRKDDKPPKEKKEIGLQYIHAASALADRVVKIEPIGSSKMMTVSGADGAKLVSAIDRALSRLPDNANLMMAKSAALCCALRFKEAKATVDMVLDKYPDHFEARQRKEHWDMWEHLFQFPSWNKKKTVLHQVTAIALSRGKQVQIVRDGLNLALLILHPIQQREFPGGIPSDSRFKWIADWSETPEGSLIAHYILLDAVRSEPYRGEGFFPVYYPKEAGVEEGYWLLQRLAFVKRCYVVLAEGRNVWFNRVFDFSGEFRKNLQEMAFMAEEKKLPQNFPGFRRACQWHMQNLDLSQLTFEENED